MTALTSLESLLRISTLGTRADLDAATVCTCPCR
jgi:hypothetical protein